MIGAGEAQAGNSVEIRRVEAPVDADTWKLLMAERDDVAQRTLHIYGEDEIKARIEDGRLGVYEIVALDIDGKPNRLGSQCLEVIERNGRQAVNVVWLKVKAGSFGPGVREAIRRSWKSISEAGSLAHWVIAGRPGWEHVLRVQGLEPVELGRLWTFKAKDL